MDLATTLKLILPGLVLCVVGLLVLTADLIWPAEGKKGWLPYVALLGLVLALGIAFLFVRQYHRVE